MGNKAGKELIHVILTKKQKIDENEIIQIFRTYDSSGDGTLQKKECKILIKDIIHGFLEVMEQTATGTKKEFIQKKKKKWLTKEYVDQVYKRMDTDGDKDVSWNEFKSWFYDFLKYGLDNDNLSKSFSLGLSEDNEKEEIHDPLKNFLSPREGPNTVHPVIQKKITEYYTIVSEFMGKKIEYKKSLGESLSSVDQLIDKHLLSSEALKHIAKSIYMRKTLKKSNDFPVVNINLVISHVDPDTLYGKNFKHEKKTDGLNFSNSHVTVCIGPWKFAWFDHSLCVPTLQNGIREAEFSYEIGQIQLTDENIRKIATEICEWNFNRYYASFENSWDFADSFLSFLGFKLTLDSFKGDLLVKTKKLIVKNYHFSFYIPEGTLKTDKKKVTFKNHKEFDEFVHELLSECKDFEKEHPDSWKVLKGFDHVFWLRHIKVRRDLEDLDEDFEIPEKCHFNDPRIYGSFLCYNRSITKDKVIITQ